VEFALPAHLIDTVPWMLRLSPLSSVCALIKEAKYHDSRNIFFIDAAIPFYEHFSTIF
jgi:hypothetical protein